MDLEFPCRTVSSLTLGLDLEFFRLWRYGSSIWTFGKDEGAVHLALKIVMNSTLSVLVGNAVAEVPWKVESNGRKGAGDDTTCMKSFLW